MGSVLGGLVNFGMAGKQQRGFEGLMWASLSAEWDDEELGCGWFRNVGPLWLGEKRWAAAALAGRS